MTRKAPIEVPDTGTNSIFRAYVTTLIGVTSSWKVALAVALLVCRSISQGAQLLLLVPLMQLVGLDVQQGSVGWLAEFVSSIFAVIGIRPTLVTVLGAFVLFTIVLALVTRWQAVFNSRLREDFVSSLRQRLYRAIANADWLTFSRTRSSDFTHALTKELYQVGNATNHFLYLITDAVVISVYLLFALRLSVVMTILVFVCGAGLLLLLKGKTQAARQAGKEMTLATGDLYFAATEHLSGMKTTKSYRAEDRNADTFSKLAERVAQARTNASRNHAATAFWLVVGSAMILSVILFVSLEALELSAAGLLLLLFLFNRMIPRFDGMQQNYQQYLNMLPSFADVMDMQARCEAAAESRAELSSEVELRRGIRFEGVYFSYGGSEAPTIHDLDLFVAAGRTTAIVGPSGAGKSTVADLVMGLVVPYRGDVLVDEAPLSAGLTLAWRTRIGYVAQETFLFNDTVRANLLWACPDANDEDIDRALRLAAATEFVSRLPDGVETVLGDRGVRLSGGERQRLALARALLREPSLLILDEATSALDSENEKRIQSAIEELHGRTTILIITHRLSTIRRADVIHVLEHGRLVESGDWETLMAKEDGRFNALARAQGIYREGESAEQ